MEQVKQHRHNILLALILLITFVVYKQTFEFGFLTNYDDGPLIEQDASILELSGENIAETFSEFVYGLYHPITSISFGIDHWIYDGSPGGFHVTNVTLHLIVVLLVFFFCKQFTKQSTIALICAALFALHPMHVESVAWLSERKDLLYTLFFIAGLITYLKYKSSNFKFLWLVVTFLLFTFSLLSKSSAVVFPVVMVLLDLWAGRPFNGRNIIEKAPFFAASVAIGIVNLYAQQSAEFIRDISDTYGIIDRVIMLFYSLSFYIVKFVWPVSLSAKHFYPELVDGLLPWYYYGAPIFVILSAWVIYRYGKKTPMLWMGSIFYLITIFLVLKLIPTGNDIVSERYSYLPYVGLGLITATLLVKLAKRLQPFVIYFGTGMVLALFALLSWQQVEIWSDEVTLWSSVVEESPESSVAWSERGRAYNSRNEFRSALKDLNKAIQLDNQNALAYNNRGIALEALGDKQQAITDYDRAITLDPDYALAYSNRGVARFQVGASQAAIDDFERALALDPTNASAYNNRGIAYAQSGNLKQAITDFEKAISLDPSLKDARVNLERAQAMAAPTEKQPPTEEALFKRATDYLRNRNVQAAYDDFNQLIKLNPNHKEAYYYRGNLHFIQDAITKACDDWSKADSLGLAEAQKMIEKNCH